jgi:uncharacterized membrane protein
VRFGWSFNLHLDVFVAQVIWVIGASMVVLAGLVYLPRWAIAAAGLIMIAGHNLLDTIHPEHLGAAGWLWNFLHQSGLVQLGPQTRLFVLYPLIPWAGVMAVGYAVGPVFKLDRRTRERLLIAVGLAVTTGFIVLRAANVYGDPAPWSVEDSWFATVLSFLNCEKYPPSLLYLMMTLGPALILLALFERAHGRIAGWITAFGRVPFFFYVLHIVVIHALAVALAWANARRCRLAVRRAPTAAARRVRIVPPGDIRGVAVGRACAAAALSLVRGAQAAAGRMVVELPLSDALNAGSTIQ